MEDEGKSGIEMEGRRGRRDRDIGTLGRGKGKKRQTDSRMEGQRDGGTGERVFALAKRIHEEKKNMPFMKEVIVSRPLVEL
jgi:hypothetical protein